MGSKYFILERNVRMHKKKLLTLGLVSVMMLSLTACGSKSKSKSTSDVVNESSKAMEKVTSFELDGETDLSVDITVASANATVNIPVSIDYDVMANKDCSMHMNLSIDANLPEQMEMEDVNIKTEAYLAKADDTHMDMWMLVDGDTDWRHTIIDISENTESEGDKLNINGEMTTTENEYVITQTFKSIMEDDNFKKAIEDGMNANSEIDMASLDEKLSSIGLSTDSIKEQLGKGTIKYSFDKKSYYITRFDIENVNLTATIAQGGDSMDIKFSFSSKNEIKNHNNVKDEDIIVPDDIKANAKDVDLSNLDLDSITSGDDSIVPGDDAPIDDDYTTEDETSSISDASQNAIEDLSTSETISSLNSIVYSGQEMVISDSWTDVFVADGWVETEDLSDDTTSYIKYTNDKYPGYELTIMSSGDDFVEYEFESIIGEAGDVAPAFSVSGISFGSSRADVLAALGNPTSHYIGSDGMSESLTYMTDDYHEVSFWIRDGVVEEISVY